MRTMQAIEDYINGNLKDAKRRARQAGRKAVMHSLRSRYYYTPGAAEAVCRYLFSKPGEGQAAFQTAADAEFKQKQARK
jgi:hypothetical protein